MPFRLPIDSPLPEAGARRWGVLAMLVLGGLVALLVPAVFAVMLYSMLFGG